MKDEKMPLFPLSIVVFPGEELRLHIFEPRYRQLIHDCLENNQTFGIPPFLKDKRIKYGTELELMEIVKVYEDGKMDIKAKGIGWFEIDEFYGILPGKLYPGGVITKKNWESVGDIVYSTQLVSLIQQLYQIMKIDNVKVQTPETFRTYQLAHKLGLNIEQEMELLIIPEETERQIYLIKHLETLIPIVREAENLRKRAELNGHFQNVIPPNIV